MCLMWSSLLPIMTLILSSGEFHEHLQEYFNLKSLNKPVRLLCECSCQRRGLSSGGVSCCSQLFNRQHCLFQDFRPWWRNPSQDNRQSDGLPLQHGRGERPGPSHEQPLQQHYQQWKPVQPDAWVRLGMYTLFVQYKRKYTWNIAFF